VKPSAESVLTLLRAHPEGITAMDALGAGCGDRLAARILEVKAAGNRITDRWETTPNGARIKRYALVPARPVPTSGVQESFDGWAETEMRAAWGDR
jgi:hypothetical protein